MGGVQDREKQRIGMSTSQEFLQSQDRLRTSGETRISYGEMAVETTELGKREKRENCERNANPDRAYLI
jgi:hypothetical protein